MVLDDFYKRNSQSSMGSPLTGWELLLEGHCLIVLVTPFGCRFNLITSVKKCFSNFTFWDRKSLGFREWIWGQTEFRPQRDRVLSHLCGLFRDPNLALLCDLRLRLHWRPHVCFGCSSRGIEGVSWIRLCDITFYLVALSLSDTRRIRMTPRHMSRLGRHLSVSASLASHTCGINFSVLIIPRVFCLWVFPCLSCSTRNSLCLVHLVILGAPRQCFSKIL